MPNGLSVKAVSAVTGDAEHPTEPPVEPVIPPVHAQPASPMPNPQLRLDPALGLVVIEFRDASGAVRASSPTLRQLNAYRMWELMCPKAPQLGQRD